MTLFLEVTRDKYELPIMVCDSSAELAKKLGVRADTVRSTICRAERNGWKCRYARVKVTGVSKNDGLSAAEISRRKNLRDLLEEWDRVTDAIRKG